MNKFLKMFSVVGACLVGLFGLTKVVSADTISSYYVSKGEFDCFSFSGSYNNSSYDFLCVNLNSSVSYNINSIEFLLCIEPNDWEASDITFNVLYCYGSTYDNVVSNLFSDYSLNNYSFFVSQTLNDYVLLNFIYKFDIPYNSYSNDFYFYVGLKETSDYFFRNDLKNNNFLVNATIESDSYNLGYSDASNYYNSYYSNLVSDYEALQTTYNTLNSNYTSLQSTYNTLVSNYSTLQQQYNDLLSEEYSFSSFFWSISAVPFGVLGSMLNFEVLGVNLFALLTGILTGGIVIWLVKKFILK